MKRIVTIFVLMTIIGFSGCDKNDDVVYTSKPDPPEEEDDGMNTASFCEECAPLTGKYNLKFVRDFIGGWGAVPFPVYAGTVESGYIILNDSCRLVCAQVGTSWSYQWPGEITTYSYKHHYIYKIVNDSTIAFKRNSKRDTAVFSPYLSENPDHIEEIIIHNAKKYFKDKQ